jgi:nucleotide-binding universal stress UspA family protein
MPPNHAEVGASDGPVLFAYDGSELARLAIVEAGRQLESGREALVVCVWQPADVGFVPVTERHFDADDAVEVQRVAGETAAHGASLAAAVGFRAGHFAVEASPTWKGIVEAADDRDASLIVIGSHRRGGLVGHLGGSVAAAVIAHSTCAVLLVHQGRATPASS